MTGRVLVIGSLLIGIGFTEVTGRACAQSRDEEENMSSSEISDESSVADSGSDETSFDDDLIDDSSRSNTANATRGRSVLSQQPTPRPDPAEVIGRADAEWHDEEDMSTGEISDESPVADSGFEATSFDDDLADDSFRPNTTENAAGRRPLLPQQPTR